MKRWQHMACVPVVLAVLSSPSRAGSVSFQEGTSGYAGCVDTTIRTDGYSTNTNTNYGTSADLRVECEQYSST